MSNTENESKKPKLEPINKELANMLMELADYEKNVNKQVYKFNAYKKAARSIKDYPHKITSGKEAKDLEGVGKKIAKKIDEYLSNGKISRLEKARGDKTAIAIKELSRVFGIGPNAARKFVNEGITSLDDLKKNIVKLNHHQKIGLKFVEDFEQKIPREEMILMKDFITKEIELIDNKYCATIAGSFRRGAEESSDIDILITHPKYVSMSYETQNENNLNDLIIDTKKSPKSLLDKIVNKLVEKKFIIDTLAFGESKFMGVCKIKTLYRRIDIRLIPNDQYYCGLLYFTGSDMFNKNMRKIAIEKGFILNEYSLRKVGATGITGKPLSVASEKDVFDYLDMELKEPQERNA